MSEMRLIDKSQVEGEVLTEVTCGLSEERLYENNELEGKGESVFNQKINLQVKT